MTMDELKAEVEVRLSSATARRPGVAPTERGRQMLANTFARLYRRLGLSG